jgi:hypothetical protein
VGFSSFFASINVECEERFKEAQALNEQLSAENIKLSEEISALRLANKELTYKLTKLIKLISRWWNTEDYGYVIRDAATDLDKWLEERGKE